jgi:hypothetical protein
VPTAATILVWRIAYVSFGYGVGGSDLYLDPASSLPRFMAALGGRLPVLLMAQLTPVPAYLHTLAGPPWKLVIAFGAAGVVAGLLWIFRSTLRASPAARFCAIGMVLSTVPAVATFAHERLLFATGVGGSALVATILARVIDASAPAKPARSSFETAAIALLAVTHLGLGPAMLPISAYSPELFARAYRASSRSLDRAPDFRGRTLVMVNGPDFFTTSWLMVLRASRSESLPRRLRVLGMSVRAVEIHRDGPRSLRLRPEGGYVATLFDTLLRRADHPLSVGDCVELDDVRVCVEATTPDHRPAEILCLFNRPLDDPDYVWVAWGPKGYQPFELPRKGHSVVLPATTLGDAWRLVRDE